VLCNLTARYAGLLLVSFPYWEQVVFRIVDLMRRRTLGSLFDGLSFGVTETVLELVVSIFYSLNDMFNAVPIPAAFILEAEGVSVKRRL